MKKITGVLLALGTIGGVVSCQSLRWQLVKAATHREFPGVARISTGQLSAWLEDARRRPPFLADVRTTAEYEVSHLPGAIRVEPGAGAAVLQCAVDQPIVTYCSVGLRSSAFAKKLQEAGFKNVANLDGSLFQWANEHRPLVDENVPTNRVHPYNPIWGSFLKH